MKVVIHANQIAWQKRYARHVVQGLWRHGIRATVTSINKRQPCDVAIIMGPNAWQNIEQSGKPYIMLNRKFVGNGPQVVHENCAISWNGFNGRGTFCVNEVDPTRLTRYMAEEELLPWRKHGSKLILCEQSNVGRTEDPKFKTLQLYYSSVKRGATLPVVFRKKPIGEKNISFAKVTSDLIKFDPKALVNLNSTISIDALTVGIPVISFDIGDPAYPITTHSLSAVSYQERLPFFQYLAHCQWTEDEIKTGEFWSHIYPMQGKKLHEWTDG